MTETTHNVPTIVVSGYLGAGKTTLLNHLLRKPGARLGVIINDFGQINVDAALVAGQVDEAASIAGGCLCCMPDSSELNTALERLSQPKLRLDAIIIEASGLAEPLTLANLVRTSGVQQVRLGGVIEVIDAIEHFRTVDISPEPPASYAAATLIVISKLDLLPAAEREPTVRRIMQRVRLRNPGVQYVIAERGRIDPALIFDTACDEDPDDQLPIAQLVRESQPAGHSHHQHARSVAVLVTRPVCASTLVDLLEHPPAGAYRMKGRVCVRGSARTEHGYLVNVVGDTIHVARLAGLPRPGELVAIGMQLDSQDAATRLASLEEAADRPDSEGLRRLRRYRGPGR